MGILSSRQAVSSDAEHVVPAHSYKYPAKSGQYFGTHFMMGGERFESAQPEMYLFGDNTDLNFLGPKPVPFSYAQPSSAEPTRTLQCLSAIRRDSLKFVKTLAGQRGLPRNASEPLSANVGGNAEHSAALVRPHSVQVDLTSFDEAQYNVEFILDCDVPCSVTIHYFATEEITQDGIRYVSKRPELSSPTYFYEIGANQLFSHPEHVFDPCLFRTDELMYNNDTDVIPVVIHCVAESPDHGNGPQSHSTLAVVEKSAEGHGFILKPLKQKIYVDGVCYLLQEIYGIENKHAVKNQMVTPASPNAGGSELRQEPAFEATNEDSGTECVVCMSELRDTLILPCRHLCLCSGCAETLRYKASACPICRAPFRALLQIKTLRRIRCGVGAVVSGHVDQAVVESNVSTAAVSFLNRYETVPLLEALNGPVEAPTVMLPINPIPPAIQTTTSVPNASANQGPVATRGPAAPPVTKRTKGKKIRTAAAIQEVLTPQALVQPQQIDENAESEAKDEVTPTDECSLSSMKISPTGPSRAIHHPLQENLLPGQADEIAEMNTNVEYMETHSVSCGEVVKRPELEGPHPTDDENEIALDTEVTTYRVDVGLTMHPPREELTVDETMDDTAMAPVISLRVVGSGCDTPNSSDSVSSTTSTHSAQPLLANQQKLGPGGYEN